MVLWYLLGGLVMSSMLKISEGAALGIHSMIVLAKAGDELMSVKYIAEKLNVSANHLSKIMQRLVKCGFVESIKGNGGGFRLAKKPQKISLLNIYEAIDGKFKPSVCLLHANSSSRASYCKPSACIFDKCALGDLLESINNQVESHLRTRTLDTFLL